MNDDTQALPELPPLPPHQHAARVNRASPAGKTLTHMWFGDQMQNYARAYARAALAAQAAPAEAQQAAAPPTLASLRGIASMPAGQTAEGIVAASRGEWADAPAQAPTDADIVKLLHALGVTEFDDLCAGETRSAVVRRWLAGFGVPGDAALPDAPEAAK